MTLDGRMLRGLFQHERLEPTNIRRSQESIQNLAQIKPDCECRSKVLLKF